MTEGDILLLPILIPEIPEIIEPEKLLELLTMEIFMALVGKHNLMLKDFTGDYNKQLLKDLKLAMKKNTLWKDILVDKNILKQFQVAKFFNEFPSSTWVPEGKTRFMSSESTQRIHTGFPDCVERDDRTGEIRGLEFKNYRNYVELQQLRNYNNIMYEVTTQLKHRERFLQNPLVSNVFVYEDLGLRKATFYAPIIKPNPAFQHTSFLVNQAFHNTYKTPDVKSLFNYRWGR